MTRTFTALPALTCVSAMMLLCGCQPRDKEPVFTTADETVPPPKDPRAVPPLLSYEHVNPVAEKAWQNILDLARPDLPPSEWAGRNPSPAEIEEYRVHNRNRLLSGADFAKEFAVRFPHHPRASEALDKEMEMLGLAIQTGATNEIPRFLALEKKRLDDPALSDRQRFRLKLRRVRQLSTTYEQYGTARFLEELEKGAMALIEEFPKEPETYDSLLTVAQNSAPEKARKLCDTILGSQVASKSTSESASRLLRRLDRVGRPLDLEFNDLNGAPVSLSAMKGKVVLVVFWASWSGQAVKELPVIQEAHAKFSRSDFDVVGISMDGDKAAMERAVQRHGILWPIYFDGKVWRNEIATKLEISGVPTMWLVNRQGVLVELNARAGFKKKVDALIGVK